jgi:acyl-CoA thioesterase
VGATADAYWNFAGPFGGYVAALCMKAVVTDVRVLGPPVAQTVNYCGALAKGPFEITTRIPRGGKATQHWSIELIQDGQVAATATIVCANRRETFAHQAVAMPSVPPVDAVPRMKSDGRLPWLSSYRFHFIEGGPRFTPAGEGEPLGPSKTVMYLADHPARPLDVVALSSLADCFILRLLQMRGASVPMIPMSTVSMTTYFHAGPEELAAQGDAPLLGVADGKRFSANFHDQHMDLWGRDGGLLATGIQTVWYKA